jgi:hypothetical protein
VRALEGVPVIGHRIGLQNNSLGRLFGKSNLSQEVIPCYRESSLKIQDDPMCCTPDLTAGVDRAS